MYTKYWRLKEKPFENTPDPRFTYYSKKHEAALTRLFYAVKEEKGAVMLTGEYGSGKTLLSRILIDMLIKDKIYDVVLITHPQLTPFQFIQEIAYQLRNECLKNPKPQLLHMIQDRMYKNFKEGKRTVILIDEAQIIKNRETFEELRLLLNFQLNDKFLITLVLIGQPELLEKINPIPQLQQRLGIRYHLTGFDRGKTEEYIKHRLAIAGQIETLFTEESIDEIYGYSKGIPREINNICDMSLLIGFGQEQKVVKRELVENIIGDLTVKVSNYAENV